MSASPAFIRALADEVSAAHQQARLAASESDRLDGLDRLADLQELAARVLEGVHGSPA